MPESNSPVSSVGYTKTEINRMSTADLQKLAAEQGIENAQETSGAELKEILIAKFNL
nr:MAG TPA: Rho termination factor, N-terminal domain [Caudoviricetes sp.]